VLARHQAVASGSVQSAIVMRAGCRSPHRGGAAQGRRSPHADGALPDPMHAPAVPAPPCAMIAAHRAHRPSQRMERDSVHIGVFGGTFDPIHNGHLAIAQRARRACALDQVMFVPAAAHPGKPSGHGASVTQRLAMVELAIAGVAWLSICDYEITHRPPVYTVDTLRWLTGRHRAAFTLVMGADAVLRLPRWVGAADIIAMARIAVAPRPGCAWSPAALEHQLPGISARITELPGPATPIASRLIRRARADGQSIDELVPMAVARHIDVAQLYRAAPDAA
jgi:nicotinate-nucleotide adenylyltransferase